MRPRKRPACDSPSLANVAREAPGTTRRIGVLDQSSVQLQQRGFVLSKLTDITLSELVVAAGALQNRLRLCGQLPARQAPPGYRAFACKERLEYEDGRPILPSSTIAHHVSHQVMRRLDDIARGLLAQLARHLKLSHEFFEPLLSTAGQHSTESASILDTIHYMPPSTDAVNPNLSANCESHVDKGLLTVIFPDTEYGLQVMTATGSWQHLQVPQGHVAVLAGYTLERATCGLVKAVTHRVVMGSGGCHTARNVIAYKLRARDAAVIDAYPAVSLHHSNVISPRFKAPIGMQELMHFFDATHQSINAQKPCETSVAAANAAAATSASQCQGEATILLVVRSQDGSELQFKTRRNTPLEKVMLAYTARMSVRRQDLRFMYEGEVIYGGSPDSHEMESGDIIDAVIPQSGD